MYNKIKSPQKLLAQILVLAGAAGSAQAFEFELEEVIVTAQKRTQSLQDVPVSVSALGSGDLEGLKLRATTEIAAQVPNMQISTAYGDSTPMISMRGVSMSDFSLNQSSPVAIYVDEVFRGNPAILGVQMFDLERVEVLRGPQGTLYGKNTTGGAVNFITKAPTHDTEGYVTAGFGEYDRKELKGAAQTSLIEDVLAVRVAGTWTEMDGYNKNKLAGKGDHNAIDEWGARITLAYTPIDDLEMILRIASSEQRPTNFVQLADNIAPGGVGFTGYNRNALDRNEVETDLDAEREIETDSVALTINYDLSDQLALTSITSWDDGSFDSPEDVDGSPTDSLHIRYQSELTQWAQDLRLTSNFDSAFNFIAGLYFSQEEVELTNQIDVLHDLGLAAGDVTTAFLDPLDPVGTADFVPDGDVDTYDCMVAGFGCTQYNKFTQNRNSIAVYFNSTYEMTDAVTLNVGLRYTEDETELDDYVATLAGVTADAGPTAGTAFDGSVFPTITQASLPEDRFVDREWSGKIGLDYTTEDGTLIYASYSKGYRSGAFNGAAFLDPSEVISVDPETLGSYELGFKSELLGNSVQLNGAVFYIDYSDQQFLNVDSATATQTLVSIDSSTITGAELELTARPLEPLMLRAGLGWLDTEVEEGSLQGVDLAGNELLAAPELNFNVSVDYDIALGDAGMLTLHLDSNFVDEQHFNIFNTEAIKGDDYWVSNARISFESADSSYTLAAWVKNIEDKTYVTQSIDLSPLGFDYFQLGAPRMAGVEATFRF